MSDDPIDWTNVRQVYRELHFKFQTLTTPFGIRVSGRLNNDLAHLIATIDGVDRELDEIDDDIRRRSFGQSLIDFLAAESHIELTASPELKFRMQSLRSVIRRHQIRKPFCSTVARILREAERKRDATTHRQLIGHLTAEWRATGELPLLLLGSHRTPEFERFFLSFCEMMPSVDMIQDAAADFRCGQIKIRPSLILYTRLLYHVVKRLPGLWIQFPDRWGLVRYCGSFLLMRPERPSSLRRSDV